MYRNSQALDVRTINSTGGISLNRSIMEPRRRLDESMWLSSAWPPRRLPRTVQDSIPIFATKATKLLVQLLLCSLPTVSSVSAACCALQSRCAVRL